MNSNRNIEQKITDIIELRQPLGAKIKYEVEPRLRDLKLSIDNLENRRLELLKSISDDETTKELNKLDFSTYINLLEEESKKLGKIRKRFLRGTINIGVVGITGHGKSTFLKTLSGLPDKLIPSREGEPCTASKSIIVHSEKDRYAKITFYSEESFIKNVIHLHYQQLSQYYTNEAKDLNLGDTPKNLAEFAERELPEIPQAYDTTKEVVYKNLIFCQKNLDEYKPYLLSKERFIRIESDKLLEELPKFIAKPDTKQNDTNYFDYIAVEQAEIFCPFDDNQVGKIAMVDIPGSQENRVGNEERIIETLGQDVDFVLFLYKPEKSRYSWDKFTPLTKLYTLVNNSINNFPERSLIVLNSDSTTGNSIACDNLKQSQKQSSIKVSGCEIADCSNKEDVKRVLEIILQKLSINDHIVKLDKNYAASCQKRLTDLYKDLKNELKYANGILDSYANENRKFEDWFDEFVEDITEQLNELKSQLYKQLNTEDKHFKKVFDQVLDSCKSEDIVPSAKELESKQKHPDFKGSLNAVYLVSIAELRVQLSKKLLELDNGLKDSVDDLKCLVAKTFVKDIKKAYFGELTEAREAEFLKVMTVLLNERKNELELGFRTLSTLNLSYSGLIFPEIRECLKNYLTPDAQTSKFKANTVNTTYKASEVEEKVSPFQVEAYSVPSNTTNFEELSNNTSSESKSTSFFQFSNAEEARKQLKELHENTVEQCRIILSGWLTHPSNVRYFMIEEFIDLILYSPGMEKEWSLFLKDDYICAKVWAERNEFEIRKQVQQEWKKIIDRAEENNQLEYMQFIN